MNKIAPPKHFTAPNVIEFLADCGPLFDLKGKRAPEYGFDLSNVKQCSMLGALVFFKIIEYGFISKCFKQPRIFHDPQNTVMVEAFKTYGFWELITNYVENKDSVEQSYRQLEIKVEDNFIIAPQALLRDSNFSSETLQKNFLPQIEEYYSFNNKIVSMIFLCLSEILLNFWEHAVDDTKSIIVASGNKNSIEIACADTGEGVISSLKKTGDYDKWGAENILIESVKKGVTSKKKSNHMGYGLWILDQIVTLVGGRMHLYSQGAFYHNDYGKVNTGKCGLWNGTIIYISLPLKNPKTLSDIENYSEKNKLDDLKINWV